jgi:hypothetical protein
MALVLPFTTAATELDAVATTLFVLLFTAVVPAVIALPNEEEAVLTSPCVAREPEVRPAPVRVRVPLFQISDTSVPTEVSVRAAFDQTDVEIVDEETTVAPTVNVLSAFTRSPRGTLPHVIVAGQTPSGPIAGML